MALSRVDGGLEVIYGQRDYGGRRLGLCDRTDRGLYGCYTTSLAMVLRHYGYDTDPGHLDDLLTMGINGRAGDSSSWSPIYVDGCAMVDDAAEQVTGGEVQLVGIYDYSNQSADMSVFQMADDEEVIVGIDGSAYFGYPTHFLRVFSWDGSTMTVCDPWNKERLDLEATFGAPSGWDLGRLIIKAVKHKVPGWVPSWKNQPPRPDPVPTPPDRQLVSDAPAAGATVTVVFAGNVFAGDAMFYDRPDGNPLDQFASVGQLTFWQGAFDGANWWDRVSTDGGPYGDWWILDSKVDTGGHTPAFFYNQVQLPLSRLSPAPYPLTPQRPASMLPPRTAAGR